MSDNVLGTYRAIVANNNDPLGEERVTLQIPQVLGDAESNWAVPNAPTNTTPNVGDVVWVTFDGGDITAPVYAAVGLTKLSSDVQTLINEQSSGTTDATIPKAPTGLSGTSAITYTTEGVGLADLSITWTAPTQNTDGTAMNDLQGYVAQWSYDDTNWAGGAYVKDAAWTFHSLLPATNVNVRVLAFDKSGNYSDYATVVVTTAANAGPPAGSTLAQQSSDIVTAQNAANHAQTTADGKNTVTYSTALPGSAANKAGDIWFVRDATSGNIVSQYEGTGGTSWVARQLSHEVIASIDAGTITVGKLTAAQIDATNLVVSGGNVSGTVQSATNATSASSATSATTVTGSIGSGVTVPAGQLSNGTIPTTTTINGGSITTGTIDASKATITNLNATNITTGTLVTDRLSVGIGGANRLSNSSFESDTDGNGLADGWAVYNNTSSTEPATASLSAGRTGGNAQRVTWSVANTSTKGITRNDLTRVLNKWYTLSFYARATTTTQTAMQLRWNHSPTMTVEVSNPVLSTTAWQRYIWRYQWTGSATLDTGVFISSLGANGTGYLEFDDIMEQEGDTATEYRAASSELLPGTITGTMITADAINGKTITGATIQTATSGQRISLLPPGGNYTDDRLQMDSGGGEAKPAFLKANPMNSDGSVGTLLSGADISASGTNQAATLYLLSGTNASQLTTSAELQATTVKLTGNATVSGGLSVGGNGAVTTTSGSGTKRQFWASYTGTCDSSGFLYVTHGAGFTPSQGFAQITNPGASFIAPVGVDTFTSTSARVRFYNWNTGAGAVSAACAFRVLWCE